MQAPRRIVMSEVGPRDGLQIWPEQIPVEKKVALIDALSATGLTKIEATGFAHPKIVPQLADAAEVLAAVQRRPGVKLAAFVPNAKGAERAVAAKVDEFKCGAAASETFNRLNVRMSIDDALKIFDEIAGVARGAGGVISGVIGTAFGCPYEGPVPEARVLQIAERYAKAGASVVYLADTTGMANPRQVESLSRKVKEAVPQITVGLHLHNTRGSGIANALAGLEAGVTEFEASIGGLGGCPYAPKAVGNICTEDFVHMLHEMGIETGIDLDKLIGAAKVAEDMLGRTLPGMVMKAGKTSELHQPKAA
jgi:hydroxymethylglutaryl-CoA lyase